MNTGAMRSAAAVDRLLEARAFGAATLAPGRARATPIAELVRRFAPGDAARSALADGLTRIVECWLESFPGNLFWDCDRLAKDLARASSPDAITANAERVAALSRGFGRRSDIRFQYVHDFLYGYDWCRWVKRSPETRAAVGPFDDEFLGYLEQRRTELEALIADDDAKYPRLEGGAHRNPFTFARDADSEARLLRKLATLDRLPVRAWDADAEARWSEPFAGWREEAARDLGLDDPGAA